MRASKYSLYPCLKPVTKSQMQCRIGPVKQPIPSRPQVFFAFFLIVFQGGVLWSKSISCVSKDAINATSNQIFLPYSMAKRLDLISDWKNLVKESCYNLSSIADKCNISDRHLRRYFLDKFGSTPQRWVQDQRMKEATKLLSNGMSIKEVSYELCYKQVSHFSREFKRFYGFAPKYFSCAK